jgi:hypothetical protein
MCVGIIGEAGSVFHIGEDYIAQTKNREVSGWKTLFIPDQADIPKGDVVFSQVSNPLLVNVKWM